jgi:tetrahydromethanopterin:alpha-L-glutamate ligase
VNDLKIGVVGIPGKWSTEILADALQQRTGYRQVVDMATVTADLTHGRLMSGGSDLALLDGLVIKKIGQEYSPHTLDRIELLRLAELGGVRIFSRPDSIIRMIDRLGCTMTLCSAGIPMPATIVTEDPAKALHAVKQFGTAVFKPLYSTKARGMRVVGGDHSDDEIVAEIDAFRSTNPMMYIQKKLELPGGDYALVFLGGKYLGAYARVAQSGAWDTTTQSGGKYATRAAAQDTIELASRAQAPFGLDFTTVDMADSPSGPVVFEVSAFGGFRGAKEGIGIDAAALYADHVVRELAEG